MTVFEGDLAFIPLGGTGEIGMNLNLYRLNGTYLAVDCGIGFGGTAIPEADIIMPDPAYIAERRDKLAGLVITHAHEDHVGAVAHLWPQLRCPVYTTPFTASILRRKLAEAKLDKDVKIHVIKPGAAFQVGPFDLRFVGVSHSTPQSQALVLFTPYGIVVHTGDWKLDPEPLVGPKTDEAAFAALGDRGVLAMVCDSTNATVEGHSGSEGDVRRELTSLIAGIKGRIAITCFASNVTRVETVALAAREAGRSVVLAGRSLRNLVNSARETGFLTDLPPFFSEDEAADIPDDNIVILITGSQGEARSALARVAGDTHPRIALGEGDTVIFSSRAIPGNERSIGLVQDNLVRRGVRVITDSTHHVHVSGHPARDELRRLYALVRPKISVPVHGEWRHLSAHAELARSCGATPIMIEDGDILNLAPGHVEVIDSAPVGRMVLDGTRVVPLAGGVMAARRRMLFNGVAVGSLVLNDSGNVITSKISAPGLFEADDPHHVSMERDFEGAVSDLPAATRRNDDVLREAAKTALRKALGKFLAKKPLVDVHVLRV
jgi:ribonuclease J